MHNLLLLLGEGCKSIPQLRQLHAHAITTGLLYSSASPAHLLTKLLYTLSTLLPSHPPNSVASSSPLLHYAVSLFTSIPNPTTFCYNTIIRSHTLLSSPLPALRFFSQFLRSSLRPDSHSFPFALKACAQLRALSFAHCLHSLVFKSGFASDLFVVNSLIHVYSVSDRLSDGYKVFDESSQRDLVSYNSLIDGFVKAGDVVKARDLFDAMPVRDSVSWSTLIAGYAQTELCEEAIELFDKMMDLDVRPDNVALVAVLSACAQLGELEMGKIVHDYVERNGIRVDSFLATGLVDLYAKCGCIDTAIRVFESSPAKNLFTWNAMLVGLAMHGHGQMLLTYFSKMIRVGIKPDGISFLAVLVGCSHGGLVDEARKLFDDMEPVYGVPRELKHYGCMADLLGRAGLIEEAMVMIKQMAATDDLFVWSGLLGGCRIHGDVEMAEIAAKHVMAIKPEDGGVYSMMANVYANAERWEDVEKIRRSLSGNREVKKKAAYSLIQLDGVPHEFIAGDIMHSNSGEIYMVLNGIREHQCEIC